MKSLFVSKLVDYVRLKTLFSKLVLRLGNHRNKKIVISPQDLKIALKEALSNKIKSN
jgi:hypothetical protein